MKRIATLIVSLAALTGCAAAHAQATPPPPSPELARLAYFAGDWTTQTTIAPGPWGPGGTFHRTDHDEWMKGGFFLISHSDFSMPPELGGQGASLSVLGYDADRGVYTEDRYDSSGRHIVMTGKLSGNTWTWTGEANYSGMAIQTRFTLTTVSPTSFTSTYEVSGDGGATWMPFWQGTATKK